MKTAAIASAAPPAMNLTQNHGFAGLLTGLVLAGCGTESTPTQDASAPRDTAPADTAAPTPRCDPSAAPVNMNGVWAVRATLGIELRARTGAFVRLCPDPQVTTANLLIRMALSTDGERVSHQVQVCQITLPRARGAIGDCPATPLTIELTPSASFASLLPRFAIPAINAQMPSTRPCSPYRPDGFTVLLGVRPGALAMPTTDPLPGWCSPCSAMRAEQCICRDCASVGAMCASRSAESEDTDGDMSPGVSVTLSAGAGTIQGEAFLAFRTTPQLDGTIIDDNRVTGSLRSTLEYALVGSRVNVFGTALDTAGVVAALPDFRFIPAQSGFVMLRADGTQRSAWDADGDGQVSCADIAARTSNFNR